MDFLSSIPNTGVIFKRDELRWGVLGTARIAAEALIPAINAARHNSVIAVGSRNVTRALEFARPFEIPKAFGSYEEVLADADVQAVYIPLPNSEHKGWALKAIEAGKHVLVEKPFALTADEAQEMISAALEKHVVLMEAFMYRYHSRYQKLEELLRKNEIGKLRFVESSFSFNLDNPDDIRLNPALGGGVLYDIGCYNVNLQRMLVGREPLFAQALTHQGSTGVDLQATATLDFGEQVYGHFSVAFTAEHQQFVRVVGTEGLLEMENPFSSHNQSSSALVVKGEERRKLNFRAENDYQKMIEQFYDVVTSREAPQFPLSDAVNNLVVLEALFQSAVDGGRMVSIRDQKPAA